MKLGQVQSLRVAKNTPYGLYLTDGTDEILLPKKETTADMIIGSSVEVFIYKDSEDRPIATTTIPPLTLGNYINRGFFRLGTTKRFIATF